MTKKRNMINMLHCDQRPSQAKDPPSYGASWCSASNIPATLGSSRQSHPGRALAMFLLALLVISLVATTTVSANIHMPTLSLCSYIFNQDRSSSRTQRAATEQHFPSSTTTFDTLATAQHNNMAGMHSHPGVSSSPPPPPSSITHDYYAPSSSSFSPSSHHHAHTSPGNHQRHAHRHSMPQAIENDVHPHSGWDHSHAGGGGGGVRNRRMDSPPPDAMSDAVPQEFVDLHVNPSYKSPPTKRHPVYIGLEIIDVDHINDAENFFSLQLHLFELWEEPRLNTSALNFFWANDNNAGSDDKTVDYSDDPIPVNEANIAECLWTPSLVFEESTEKESLLPPTSILLAYKNNVLLRKSRFSLKVRCHMNLQIYPMDKHQCHFKVRTFTDPMHKVDLRWLSDEKSPKRGLLDKYLNKSVVHRGDFTPSLFDIRVGSAERIIHAWLHENYSMLDVEFIFERRIIHSLLTVYIPSSLVVTLSWLQFWFDVEAVPGRMSLGIMSTLTIMTQILTNYEKAGNHVTAVDIWLFIALIWVFMALMEYAVAYTFSHYYDSVEFSSQFKDRCTQTSNRDVLGNCGSAPSVLMKTPKKRSFFANSTISNLPQQTDDNNNNNNNNNNNHRASREARLGNPTPIDIDRLDSLENKQQALSKANTLPVPSPIVRSTSGGDTSQQSTTELFSSGDEESDKISLAVIQNRLNASEEKMHEALSTLKKTVKETGNELDRELRELKAQPELGLMSASEFEQFRRRLRQRQRMLNELDKMQKQYDRENENEADFWDLDDEGNGRALRKAWMHNYCSHNGHSKMSQVDYASRFIFPIAFVLFVIVYWIVLIYYKLTS